MVADYDRALAYAQTRARPNELAVSKRRPDRLGDPSRRPPARGLPHLHSWPLSLRTGDGASPNSTRELGARGSLATVWPPVRAPKLT